MKLLFLSVEGYQPTIFESQIINLKLFIEKNFPLDCLIVSFVFSNIEKIKAQEALSNQNILFIKGIKTAYPFARLINSFILYITLKKNKFIPNIIHCRTEHSFAIAFFLKLLTKTKLIWDCRGLSYREYVFTKHPKKVLKFYKFLQGKIDIYLAKAFCDKAIFVSTSLKEYYTYNKNNSFIIPCLSDPCKFFYSESLRKNTRKALNILDEEKLFVFVGSNAKWQNLDETLEYFKKLQNENYNIKLLLLTNEKLTFSDNITAQYVEHKNVNKYLNAADYAFFLRDNIDINNVASPVKFSEYSLTGLKVIQTDSVHQSVMFGKDIGNYVSLKSEDIFKDNLIQRDELATRASKYYSLANYIKVYKEIYCL